jgi:hypothetical protein
MYWRCVRLYRAALILIWHSSPEEALIIARSLFEESLRFQEMADDPAGREVLILGWLNRSIHEQRGLVREAASLGIEGEPEALLAKVAEQQAELDRYIRKNNVGSLRNFAQPRVVARKHGRIDDFWTYLSAHEVVHGSDFALKLSRKKLQSGTIGLYLTNEDPGLLLGVAAFCARSALLTARSAARIFGWQEPPEIAGLLDEIGDYDPVGL